MTDPVFIVPAAGEAGCGAAPRGAGSVGAAARADSRGLAADTSSRGAAALGGSRGAAARGAGSFGADGSRGDLTVADVLAGAVPRAVTPGLHGAEPAQGEAAQTTAPQPAAVPAGAPHPFTVGESITVTGPEGRHAVSVKRLTVGETVVLTDGAGHAARGEITAVAGKDSMTVHLTHTATLPPRTPRVVVVQAIPKSERAELAVDLATQAGADAIVPWQALRCVSKWAPGAKTAKAREKWAQAAKAAAKQSRRWDIPPVAAPATTSELAQAVQALVQAGGCAVMLDEEGATPFAQTVRAFTEAAAANSAAAVPTLALIVGPEGGIDPAERATLAEAGAQAVVLGPEVLRTASAAAVALGALGALTPRWAPIMKF